MGEHEVTWLTCFFAAIGKTPTLATSMSTNRKSQDTHEIMPNISRAFLFKVIKARVILNFWPSDFFLFK